MMHWLITNSEHFEDPLIFLTAVSAIYLGWVGRKRARGDLSKKYNPFVVGAIIVLVGLDCFFLCIS
jgi:putative Mn2+ efflux pump MntP